MMIHPDVLTFSLAPLLASAGLRAPERAWAASGSTHRLEVLAMAALNEIAENTPPPNPEKMAAGKARLLALAEARRREREVDLIG